MSGQVSESSSEEKSPTSHGYASLLRNRQFMSLWIAQVFSQFGDRAVFVLFVAILTEHHARHTGILAETGAAELTSWLYVAFTIPAVVLSPIAGVYVDRWSQRQVLVLSNLARAGCVALVALPAVSRSILLDFTLAFLISVGCQFFGPAETATIPRVVKKEQLFAANSLFFTTMMIALGFGFAIGEPIITHIGTKNAPLVIAGFFALASFLLLSVSDSRAQTRRSEAWWEELRFGLSYIADNPIVLRAIFKITILFSTIITLNIVAVGIAQQVLKIAAHQFGYIVAAAGVGMGIGNFWVAHYGTQLRPSALAYSGFCGLGLFMCLLGSLGVMQRLMINQFGVTDFSWQGHMMFGPLGLAALIGMSCALVAVPTQASLQAVVPEELRGKVFGAQITAMSAASTIPVIMAGALIDNLPGGVSTTLWLVGLPILLAGIYHLTRTLRQKSDDSTTPEH